MGELPVLASKREAPLGIAEGGRQVASQLGDKNGPAVLVDCDALDLIRDVGLAGDPYKRG